ncbi:ABC transporter ATP-binding protein [Labrys monachus]|uniref:Spermidine/putrescine transport system ATP-binding protein/spermidine/putrescine transport system ATP-binding protein n=1 Tax=Labrys monachus TaxID=217067 RepID=A0ABU0FBP7_9HYPH|nr:ABC transporter ATP-binding protein [Labrys monachus]MDQ0392030.1 putative spermidine/putrescine transport system ATP-binding protein/spermidine/putrescine transport system ATP-binding protein [Labrys monachus]
MIGVDVSSIGKGYGTLRVLDQVSASFKAGQFTSLLGPSGSGKTTLLRIIGGFIEPDEGAVRFGGEDVTHVPLWQRKVGMVFQSYALFPHMSVQDNVVFGLNRRGIRGEAARRQVAEALEMVHLTGLEQRKPRQLSGGQQQRVALARAIVTKPRVLLLDEPLSALDRRLRQDMQIELRRIQRESGLTTIFVTHDQEEALTLSDTVAILDRGHIVQEGAPLDIYERPRTRFAASFLGDANFFTGTAGADGIEAAGGLIRTADRLPSPGTRVTAAVRPEKMRLLPQGTPEERGQNSCAVILREVIYAGSVSTFLAEGPDGTPIKVLAQNREASVPAVGQAATLAWSPEHTVLVAD